jgi:hypothetical protein
VTSRLVLYPFFLTSKNKGMIPMHRFLIVIEKAGKNFSAYSPDLPGCVATGKTREDTEERMHGAIQNAYPGPC